jgi:hypothetical protein
VTDLQVRYIDEQSTVIAERRVRFADRHDVTLRVMYLDRTEQRFDAFREMQRDLVRRASPHFSHRVAAPGL